MTTSDFLFARPSFFEGIARILDFGNTLQEYNVSLTPEMADYRALMADWEAISEDMMRVFEKTETAMWGTNNEQEN